ncbi:efflux transporter outer membrane subunit [Bordetella petrii]|uniref:efflux transporter outer membrane subunit n=1 Tax=Bordetella petrii TaxID=94624 RepID=UPI001E3AD89E|nr:efflux transporter outer membrane subunit [Bordetella petrii]MCD0502492.1 efflux transporter outer membrane subunit [Bordetella petrii]
MPSIKRLAIRGALLGMLAVSAGCAVGPDFVQPGSGLDAARLQPKEGRVMQQLPADPVPRDWWKLLNDPVLDGLIARAWDGNLDLQEAAARVEQSRARAGIALAELFPSVDMDAGLRRGAISENGPMAALGASTAATDIWRAGFQASWELDLWGRLRRQREGAVAALQATIYEQRGAQVSLSAEIARQYVALRGVQARLAIADQNQKIAAHLVRLTQSRRAYGVATRFDLASAQAQQAAVDALIPALRDQQNVLLNALALLVGEPPRSLDAQLAPNRALPETALRLPVGLPSELALRRPDIQRASARLHAATAAIGVAKADFYPRVSLLGGFGAEAFEARDLGLWESTYFSFGPSIHLPIFEGGRLVRMLELTQARQREAAIAYRRTVLQAWHEVDDAFNAMVAQQRRQAALRSAMARSREALQAAQRSYQEGAVDYVTVLAAQRGLLESELALSGAATGSVIAVVRREGVAVSADIRAGLEGWTRQLDVAFPSVMQE